MGLRAGHAGFVIRVKVVGVLVVSIGVVLVKLRDALALVVTGDP